MWHTPAQDKKRRVYRDELQKHKRPKRTRSCTSTTLFQAFSSLQVNTDVDVQFFGRFTTLCWRILVADNQDNIRGKLINQTGYSAYVHTSVAQSSAARTIVVEVGRIACPTTRAPDAYYHPMYGVRCTVNMYGSDALHACTYSVYGSMGRLGEWETRCRKAGAYLHYTHTH